MKVPVVLLAITLLLALPGLWLVQRPARTALAAGAILLLAATATGYAGVRQWRESPPPFALTAPPGQFQGVRPGELPAALAAARGRPVLLEFHADWCPSCLTWQREVFSRADVQARLAPVVLLRVDATDMDPEVQALLARHGLAGLPALLVYDRQGREQPSLRLLGEMKAPDFMKWVNDRMLPAT